MVNVSSIAGRRNISINQLNHYPEGCFGHWKIYSQTKTCNILFTIELAVRLKNTSVTTYSLHPGVIKIQFFTHYGSDLDPRYRFVYEGWLHNISDNVPSVNTMIIELHWRGADPSIYCSVQKGIESFSVGIFRTVTLCPPYKSVQDPDLPRKLWEVTEKLLGLDKQS